MIDLTRGGCRSGFAYKMMEHQQQQSRLYGQLPHYVTPPPRPAHTAHPAHRDHELSLLRKMFCTNFQLYSL